MLYSQLIAYPKAKFDAFSFSYRPLFLSEKVLDDIDAHEDLVRQRKAKISEERELSRKRSLARAASSFFNTNRDGGGRFLEMSLSRSRQAKTARSSASLLGAYVNLEKEARKKRSQTADVFRVVDLMIKEYVFLIGLYFSLVITALSHLSD